MQTCCDYMVSIYKWWRYIYNISQAHLHFLFSLFDVVAIVCAFASVVCAIQRVFVSGNFRIFLWWLHSYRIWLILMMTTMYSWQNENDGTTEHQQNIKWQIGNWKWLMVAVAAVAASDCHCSMYDWHVYICQNNNQNTRRASYATHEFTSACI